ncbi:MAG: peptide deformylase [Clostridia bacterium]|jgi:peptide deformylase|nr:peptide deformylase [Clostridiaceae bacterium]
MAIRKIVKIGDDVLTKKAKSVDKYDKKLAVLIDDMFDTMYDAGGIGLAAPQIGILRRIVVIDVGDGPVEMVNPVIVEASGEQTCKEGCLSVPGMTGDVIRPAKLTVKAMDREGNEHVYEAEELFAVCICHELDHLDGILFKDRAVKLYDEEDQEIPME